MKEEFQEFDHNEAKNTKDQLLDADVVVAVEQK